MKTFTCPTGSGIVSAMYDVLMYLHVLTFSVSDFFQIDRLWRQSVVMLTTRQDIWTLVACDLYILFNLVGLQSAVSSYQFRIANNMFQFTNISQRLASQDCMTPVGFAADQPDQTSRRVRISVAGSTCVDLSAIGTLTLKMGNIYHIGSSLQ